MSAHFIAEAVEQRILLSTINTIASFDGTDGANPVGSLTLSDGNLYGIASGLYGAAGGEIFSVPVEGGSPGIVTNFNDGSGIGNVAGSLVVVGNDILGVARSGGAYWPHFYRLSKIP